jgi:hypothetical protein
MVGLASYSRSKLVLWLRWKSKDVSQAHDADRQEEQRRSSKDQRENEVPAPEHQNEIPQQIKSKSDKQQRHRRIPGSLQHCQTLAALEPYQIELSRLTPTGLYGVVCPRWICGMVVLIASNLMPLSHPRPRRLMVQSGQQNAASADHTEVSGGSMATNIDTWAITTNVAGT